MTDYIHFRKLTFIPIQFIIINKLSDDDYFIISAIGSVDSHANASFD